MGQHPTTGDVELNFATILVASATFAGPVLLDGTYEVAFYNPATKKIEPQSKDLPPGQIRRGYIRGSRFAIVDMMVGFQGPIRKNGAKWSFVFEEGPAGKVKGKASIADVTASADMKTLTFKLKADTMMVWTWKESKVPFKLPY